MSFRAVIGLLGCKASNADRNHQFDPFESAFPFRRIPISTQQQDNTAVIIL